MLRKVSALALVLFACTAFARVRSVSHPQLRVDGGTVSGVVSSVQGNLIQIADGAIAIDATDARIVAGRGQDTTIADVKPGMQLFATLRTSNPSSHGGLPASLITIVNPADVTLGGAVQSVDAAGRSFMLLNETIVVDDNTSFGGFKREGGTSFADLQTNVVVHVQADNVGGRLVAREVLIVAPAPPQVELVKGTVDSIAADSWTVHNERGTFTFLINAQTKVVGSPKVGDTVEVLYNIDSAHNFVAISIIKFERPTVPVVQHFHGGVKAIDGNNWTVTVDGGSERRFTVNERTKVTPGIVVGDRVDVMAIQNSDGTLTALAIVKLRL
jgi:hypothetical protein